MYPTVTGTYVDNVSIISFLTSLVTARAKLIEKFRSVGIPLVWTQPEPVKKLEIVGAVVLSFEEKFLDNKPSRLWNTSCFAGPFGPKVCEGCGPSGLGRPCRVFV